MPESGVVDGGAAAAAASACLHLYVYYKIDEADLAAVLPAVLAFQSSLRGEHAGLQTTLMRRPGAAGGLLTLMESCRVATPGSTRLREQLAQGPASLQPWLRGERHLEEFVPCA